MHRLSTHGTNFRFYNAQEFLRKTSTPWLADAISPTPEGTGVQRKKTAHTRDEAMNMLRAWKHAYSTPYKNPGFREDRYTDEEQVQEAIARLMKELP